MDRYFAFIYGLIIGLFLGSIGWALLRYLSLCVRDLVHKKKEARFKLGKNIKNGSEPKLISLDDN